ncbi:MAG: hypothetical protein ABWY35_01120 [Pseudorhodoplanes sp.]
MQREIYALVEAVRQARTELEGMRDPQRQLTAERAVRRLSRLLESKELDQAMSRLQTEEDSPPIAPGENVDLRVPYPWRSH